MRWGANIRDASVCAQVTPDAYVVNRGESASSAALILARGLRARGLVVELDGSGAAFGKQFKRADRSGARWALVLGDDEVEGRQVRLKPLQQAGEPQSCDLDDLQALSAVVGSSPGA